MSRRLRVIFVAGAGRSGTTLLDLILGQIPGVVSLGEIHHIWDRSYQENQLCGCGRPFLECDFWSKVSSLAFGSLNNERLESILRARSLVTRIPSFPKLLLPRMRSTVFQSNLNLYSEVLEDLFKAVQDVSGAAFLVDSSKSPMHGLVLANVKSVELHVVHLVRDSRAVLHSHGRKRLRPEIYWTMRYMPRWGLSKGLQEWLFFNWSAGFLKNVATSYTVISYECFAEKPKRTVEQIWQTVVSEPVYLSSFVDDRTVRLGLNHTVSGNPLRFRTGRLEIQVDNEWRSGMSLPKQWMVGLLTYPLRARLMREVQRGC